MNDLEKVLIIGCGDIGVRVARRVRSAGGHVAAFCRSMEWAMHLEEVERIDTQPGNLDDPAALDKLDPSGRTVFYFAPPPGGGPIDGRMRKFCAAVDAQRAPDKVVYISTSGVYGDCGGGWVTEETPVNPQTSRAQRRIDAETTLTAWGEQLGVPVVILRVTGIYGPGRLPLARLQQGHPVLCEKESSPTNRIHAEDLATVCIAAAERGEGGDIFNVSDGKPGTMTEYFNAIADHVGLPRPPQVSMEEAKQVMNPMMLSYLQESRRMDCRKMIEKLGVVLAFPDLDAGLKDVVTQMDQPNMGYLGSVPSH